ncbi:MAG: hypothetical protein ACE5JK_05635 [Candidatus Omnitrophota bacterium]
MYKMSLATGSLVLLGFFLIMFGVILKFSGLNLLEPLFYNIGGYFAMANTCFLIALVVEKFDKPSE